jgi:hypothetical protein
LALAGYGRICQRGRKFDAPEACKKAAEKFRERSNILFLYVKDRLEQEPASHIRLRDMRHDMMIWGENQGIGLQPPGKNLKGELENLGHKIGEMDGFNSIKGYRFKTAATGH